jgi:membrane protein YqaA with SNARE-associated domain
MESAAGSSPTSDPAPASPAHEPILSGPARPWRSLVGLVLGLAALAGLSVVFLLFPIDFERIGRWGYLGVAATVFVATASVALPIPYLLIVARAGTYLDPWLLAAVAGVAGMLGELTGYVVGRSGSTLVARGRWYDAARGWICDYGFWCIAFFACVPNPVFDALGLAAGVLRYSVWRFALACLLGKALKFLIAALIGEQIHAFGWLD